MRRIPIEIPIILFAIVMLILGWRVYGEGEFGRIGAVSRMKSPSQIYVHLLIRYDKPPVYEEEYAMQDIEGVSTYSYRIRGYDGKQITIAPPRAERIYDVSYFFGKLVQDGVWQIVNRPPRGDTSARYTIYVKQLADFKQGDRTVNFTDPEYWATTAGRQYSIDLSKQKPSDLLTLSGTTLADPHYRALVQDFRAFGPPNFRAKVNAAEGAIRAPK